MHWHPAIIWNFSQFRQNSVKIEAKHTISEKNSNMLKKTNNNSPNFGEILQYKWVTLTNYCFCDECARSSDGEYMRSKLILCFCLHVMKSAERVTFEFGAACKSCRYWKMLHIFNELFWLQKSSSMQPRTSPDKFAVWLGLASPDLESFFLPASNKSTGTRTPTRWRGRWL